MKQPLSNDLVEVLNKPNNMRTAIEIRHIAIWFKENIMAFKDVSIEILMKLVAECKAEFKYPHEIIIREGDIGDCMYVLLSGRVSVHYRGDQNTEINEEIHELMNVKSNSFIPVKQNVSDTVNEELGPQVGQLEAGSVFGEVALIEDCLRTANKIKKQIAMSLIKQTYEYNQIILKQNSIFNGLYFIQRGELRIELHVKNFQDSTTYRNNSRSVKYDLPLINGSNPNTPEKTG
ncbi:hypothetical protein Smp_080650 [Schistosoma mansoni]|uniref:hypothetical protein n=1 Tax=Schistosoma mansoni TaxID=6183 RepID=UPI0001A61B77|nr:hypothetical protein Smp_080650 [Schistosoma mansoni]|eukprot:XP_018646723.1 hypothetical protein Smp_080650 [Schistosoma mansoni]